MDEYGAFRKYKTLKQIRSEPFKLKVEGFVLKEITYGELYDMKSSGIITFSDFTKQAKKKYLFLKDEYKRIYYSKKNQKIMESENNGKRIQ
jgi:hypothetical protein